MGSFGGYYKGEKKKQKKEKITKLPSGVLGAAKFNLPEIVSKKKRE